MYIYIFIYVYTYISHCHNGKVHRTAELFSAQLLLLMKGTSVPSVTKVTQLLHKGSTVLHDMENCTLNILICTFIHIIYRYTYIYIYIHLVCVLMMHVFLCPLNSMCVCIYIYSHCPALGVYLGTSIGGRNASSLPRGVPGMSKMFAVSKLWAMERQPFVHTWWLIPVSKWIITPVISGISRVNLPITGVISRLLSGMSHQVGR